MKIRIALTVLKPWRKRALGLDIERIRDEVADDLVERIMGHPESETIILKPSMTGPAHAPWLGKWDHDEPHPHPDLPIGDH